MKRISEDVVKVVYIYPMPPSFLQTMEEIDRFLIAARKEGDHVFILYATAIFSGLRAGELVNLRWTDIDFGRNTICVQWSSRGRPIIPARLIPLHGVLRPRLLEWSSRRPDQEYVFVGSNGEPMNHLNPIFGHTMRRVSDAVALPARPWETTNYRIGFGDLQHTFASQFVIAGGDLLRLARMLGYPTTSATMVYQYLSPALSDGRFDRFGSDLLDLGTGNVASLATPLLPVDDQDPAEDV